MRKMLFEFTIVLTSEEEIKDEFKDQTKYSFNG